MKIPLQLSQMSGMSGSPKKICIWLDVHMSSMLGTIILRKIKGLKMKLMKALDIDSYKEQKSSFIV